LSSPDIFGFVATLKVASLDGRLAEEILDVMPEDDAQGMPDRGSRELR
jgi:hypothetical protein